MKRLALALAGLLTAAAASLSGPPAQAAGVAVSSPSCGALRFANSSGAPVVFMTDGAQYAEPNSGTSTTQYNLPSGEYVWEAWNANTDQLLGKGYLNVAGCSTSWPRRPIEGDQNGDRKADVLGIQAVTGDLYYYEMTATGLKDGIKAGTSWNNMVFMQQVDEMDGTGGGRYLIAVRNDGNVYQYQNLGKGRFSSAKLVGTGLKGYTNFTILPLNTSMGIGSRLLLASKSGVLYGFELMLDLVDTANPMVLATNWGGVRRTIAMKNFDTDHFGDILTIRNDGLLMQNPITFDVYSSSLFGTPVRRGSGWGAMGIVASPGSLNGDIYNDLIARRDDGNLYKYINAGGRWNEGVRIGRNWLRIRLLA